MDRRDLVFLAVFLGTVCLLARASLLSSGAWLGNFGDVYAYHLPLRHLAASTLQEGRLPLWNPYIFAGTPLLANPQAALFSPLSALFQVLSAELAFEAHAVLHLALAYLGAALLARRWALGPSGAFALGTTWALSAFVLYRIPQGVPTLLAALAFVPWTWLAAEAASAPLFGLAVGLQLLSGHPQFLVINLLGLALYLGVRRPRALAPVVLGGAVAAAVTAAQWAPTLEFMSHSVRRTWTAVYASAYSLEPRFLLSWAAPWTLGTPFPGGGFDRFPSEYFELAALYQGLAAPLLALAGAWALARRRAGAAVLLVAAAGLFLAFGANNPLFRPWLESPGFGSLRVPARYMLLALWAVWLASAAGWRLLPAGAPGRRLRAALAAFVLLDLGVWQSRFLYAQPAEAFVAPNPAAVARLRAGPRYATAPDVPNANKGMLYRLANVAGYEAFYLGGAALYASRAQGVPSADGSHVYVTEFRAPGLAALGLRWFVTPAGILENPQARPLAWAEAGPEPVLERAAAEAWDLAAAAGSTVVLAQAAYPGWRAWAAGREAELSVRDGFLQRLAVPEDGRFVPVRVRFDPPLWKAALAFSAAAMTALLAWTRNSFTS